MKNWGWYLFIAVLAFAGMVILINLTGMAVYVNPEGDIDTGEQFPGTPGQDEAPPETDEGDNTGNETNSTLPVCGDEICQTEENNLSCPQDCNLPINQSCGNGVCEVNLMENLTSCPEDCQILESPNVSEAQEAPLEESAADETTTENPVAKSEKQGVFSLENYKGLVYKVCTKDGKIGYLFGEPPDGYEEPTTEDCLNGRFSPPVIDSEEEQTPLRETILREILKRLFGFRVVIVSLQ